MPPVIKRRTRRRSLLGTLSGLVLVISAAFVPAASAGPAGDEISKTPNMHHLANIPKQGPLAAPAAYGSDWAFKGRYAFGGNYEGFTVYDISRPQKPRVVTVVHCPGSQNDVSIAGNLLFLSTDSSRSDDSCQSVAKPATDKTAWEGIKIFDISDVRNPRYVKAVETKCGSHTNTLVPGKRTAYIYVSSYNPSDTYPDCRPPHDLISIVKVPLRNPTAASVAAEPVLFPDGGNPGDPPDTPWPGQTRATSGCHDLTAYPDKDLMAGACMGDGVLFDISDPLKPRTITSVRDDENFAFWHSATFNNRANKIVFTDELGGGSAATCNPTIGQEKGANAIYDIVGKGKHRKLKFRSYYKIPRHNTDNENCVAHNGSLIPVKGKDIMVQSWYQGGISVMDFTDSRNPKEIAWLDRGQWADNLQYLAGTWSTYYYNGYIYSNEIQRGLDVIDLRDPRTDRAKRVRLDVLNAQSQPNYYD
ncbi:Secreted protein containing C-terminal beta-propeller domain distantly related to WD-40 repeats [Actinomadura madurae]|nr:Secreted protein containing C-terminal beta-propeller domain distantly related to WD-40 repeats [Actinomadura madurae]